MASCGQALNALVAPGGPVRREQVAQPGVPRVRRQVTSCHAATTSSARMWSAIDQPLI